MGKTHRGADAEQVVERPSRRYGLDAQGFEHPDPTPVEMPTRLRLPQRQVDRVREVIRRELSMRAQDEGYESFDEADDFDLPGEDPISPYEEVFEPAVPRDVRESGKGGVEKATPSLAKQPGKAENAADVQQAQPGGSRDETGSAEPDQDT